MYVMKYVCVWFVLMAVVWEQMLAAVLFGSHLTNAHEVEENILSAHRKSLSEHDHRSDFPHAGIITSDTELEEFKNLSPNEAKAKLKSILIEIDKNHDGQIDKKELAQRILETFRQLSAEESDSEFVDSDTNNDGLLTWKEYLIDTYAPSEEDIPISNEDDIATEEKALFDAADQNNDGYLTLEEFRIFYTPEDYEYMTPLVLKDVINQVDLDDDKKITFDEFINNRGSNDPKLLNDEEWIRVEKIKFEQEYDINGDGILDGEEILLWLMPNNKMMSNSEAEDLIKQTDKNDDGILSYDEIMNNYLLFVSAGDYSYDFKDEL
ncbi:reticulocalbin-2-like [Daktulosphaira vitifoliae]|uniref:reticulocalbin-2-like n=1 Tax=Daktulosphaira vitifoliae TaxID=58002 RepID=UPI0021A9A645|nr:reticulocalbin-2-like [Daktulosphaira vitifoliae]